jgi:hypothetical protein
MVPLNSENKSMSLASAMILGIRGIEESSVYQDIFAKGEAAGLAKVAKRRAGYVLEILLRIGPRKLGQPSAEVRTKLDAINDPGWRDGKTG